MATEINAEMLKSWPLPAYQTAGDKEERGHALIIAGSTEIPGAAVLAGIASLRAGAGKLTIATAQLVASIVAQSIPEARVIALPAEGTTQWKDTSWLPESIDALLIGPGMQESLAIRTVEVAILKYGSIKMVLDAAAMSAIKQPRIENNILITPHAGELATLLGCDKESVRADAAQFATHASKKWNVTVALKGSETYIALPDHQAWVHRGGDVGLATSGSGDVLAGLIVGLLAQGAALEQAASWGVAVHALAGSLAAREAGCRIGYLAREISLHASTILSQLRNDNPTLT